MDVKRFPQFLFTLCWMLSSLSTTDSSCFVPIQVRNDGRRPLPAGPGAGRTFTTSQLRQSESDDAPASEGAPRRRGVLFRITGDGTPYDFPARPVPFQREWTDAASPFTAATMGRIDSSDDRLFYLVPRLVYHIDEPAVCALTQHYRRAIAPGGDVLDLCSSWVSHFPAEFPAAMGSIAGVGMNPVELALNDQLTGGYTVLDLNRDAGDDGLLPYGDGSFDAVTCACSFDYLVRPIDVLREVHRVLRPGGIVVLAFSNRFFGTKATRLWRTSGDRSHIELLNAYFHYAGGYGPREAYDITAELNRKENWWDRLLPLLGRQDPMFVVQARKDGGT